MPEFPISNFYGIIWVFKMPKNFGSLLKLALKCQIFNAKKWHFACQKVAFQIPKLSLGFMKLTPYRHPWPPSVGQAQFLGHLYTLAKSE